MSAYFIRPLTRQDEDFLWEMLYHALHVPAGQASFPREILTEPEISRYALGWGKAGDEGFVAVDRVGLKPVGAAWFRRFAAEEPGYGYVDADTPELSVAVLPDYRGRGVGTVLLQALIDAAQGQYSALSLSVSSENPAVRLYRRLGFEILGQAGSSLVMKKVLDGGSLIS